MNKTLTDAQKKADTDLWIIIISTLTALIIYMVMQSLIETTVKNTELPILPRTLCAALFEFGLAGLGITIVSVFRGEPFSRHGLNGKNILPSIGLSALCAIPYLIFVLLTEENVRYLPFQSVYTTKELLQSGFPVNITGLVITALVWGFLEGFNYIVISDKINERYPSDHFWLDWGALACSVICILIHGAIGVHAKDIFEMLTIICIIYGMILVRKKTGNAWGAIAVFVFFWNAL